MKPEPQTNGTNDRGQQQSEVSVTNMVRSKMSTNTHLLELSLAQQRDTEVVHSLQV